MAATPSTSPCRRATSCANPQIAKHRGAHVIGTARAHKHEFLRSIGIDEVIDYSQTDFAEHVEDIDVVVDAVGGDYPRRSLRTMRPGGILVSLVSQVDDELRDAAAAVGVWVGFPLTEPDHAGMQAVADLAAAGVLRPEIARVLPLTAAADAHRLGETGRTTGKIVLQTSVQDVRADHRPAAS